MSLKNLINAAIADGTLTGGIMYNPQDETDRCNTLEALKYKGHEEVVEDMLILALDEGVGDDQLRACIYGVAGMKTDRELADLLKLFIYEVAETRNRKVDAAAEDARIGYPKGRAKANYEEVGRD